MTALCGGGVSGPKAGVAETIIFTTSALASVLNNKGGAWATLVAPLLGVLAYQATELCEVDPPADPGMTAEDYLHLLRLDDFGAVASATAKLADLARIAIWYEVCECKTTTTPVIPPDALAPPEGIGSPQPVTTTPCWSTTQVITPQVVPANIGPGWYHLELLPNADAVTIDRSSPHADHQAKVISPTWKQFRVRASVDSGAPTSGVFWTVGLTPFTNLGPGNGADLCLMEIDNNPLGSRPADKESTCVPLAGQLYLAPKVIQDTGTAYPITVQVEVWCDAVGGTSASPCGPDPGTLALLQQVWELLKLVQRQHVPFAYVPGPVFTGLSGQGELAIEGALGFSVELTTVSTIVGSTDSHPDELYQAGRVSAGTADGFEASRPVTTSPYFQRLSGDATRIGYSFAAGCVATIRLWLREP